MRHTPIQSPRTRYLIQLPDEPKPNLAGSIAQLALLVVVVNIGACLLAAQVMADRSSTATSSAEVAENLPLRKSAADDQSPAGRLAKMLFAN